MLTKGPDQPIRDFLADLPHAAMAGICLCSDPRGIADPVSGKRFAYLLMPSSETAATFWRIDLETRAKTQLAALPAAAAGTYLFPRAAALFDFTGGAASDTPTVYVMVALSAAPWVQWMAYNVRTGAWAAPLAVPVLTAAAAFATSVALAHPCGTLGTFAPLNANIAEDFIYCNGNGGAFNAVAGPSNLARYAKAAGVWTYLTGAGVARVGAPAAGSKLVWLPVYPDRLYSNRGGASAALDYYSFSTNAWTATAPIPAVLLDEGTELVTLYEAPGWIAVRPGGAVNQILALEGGGLGFQNVCQIDDAVLPAAHASNALIAWWMGGQFYFGVVCYGRSDVYRIQPPMPL